MAHRASAHLAMGDLGRAESDFHVASEKFGRQLDDYSGVLEAESKLVRGDRAGALSQTESILRLCLRNEWNSTLCRCNALLGYLILPDDPAKAIQHLSAARSFAKKSVNAELQLRVFHSACLVHLYIGDFRQSISEGEAGIELADNTGFGKWSIDVRLSLAQAYLGASEPEKALRLARNSLDRSEQQDSQYAWGQAEAAYICGVAHLRLGERELAEQRLAASLALQEKLQHPRIEEARRELARCKSS